MPRATRLRFWREIKKHWIFTAVTVIWAILGGLSTVTQLFLSPDMQKKISFYPLLSKFDWHVWIIGFVVIVALMLSESYFRFYNEKQTEIDALQANLTAQIQIAKDKSARYLRRSTEIIDLETRLRVAEGVIGPKERELAEAYATIGRLQNVLQNDSVPSLDDPRIILEFSSERLPFPAWDKFPDERPIFIRNIGRSEALDIKVQDVTLGNVTAKFRTIGIMLPNSPVGVRPDITGTENENLAGVHEFEVLLQREWLNFTLHGFADQLSGQSLSTEIVIKYDDHSRVFEFSTSATVTYNQSSGVTQASNFVHVRRRREKGASA